MFTELPMASSVDEIAALLLLQLTHLERYAAKNVSSPYYRARNFIQLIINKVGLGVLQKRAELNKPSHSTIDLSAPSFETSAYECN